MTLSPTRCTVEVTGSQKLNQVYGIVGGAEKEKDHQ
jgi:hypothetical protein